MDYMFGASRGTLIVGSICSYTLEQLLYGHIVGNAVKLGPFFVLAASFLGKMLPVLGILPLRPLFHLLFPVIVGDGIVEQPNTARGLALLGKVIGT